MPSSSLFLRSSTTLVSALLLLSPSVSAATNTYYALDTEYSGTSFFDRFSFFNDADPTHGFVTYVDGTTARNSGLVSFDHGSVQMKVDSKNTYDGTKPYWGINGVGRPSVRIETVDSWTHGLFITDIKHMPTSKTSNGCSVWPAFWTLGSGTWPYNGEVDIIEGANIMPSDLSAAHTAQQCVIAQSPLQMTGTSNGNNCQYDVNTGANAAGCASYDTRSQSYGAGFNANNGGVYAMEWKSDAIKIWFFPRQRIPSDIAAGTPDPSTWGTPSSIFNGPGCDIDANFADHRIVFDTTFCGDWGEATWTSSGCAANTKQDKCSVYVGSNPSEFSEAYWDVNYVKVFQSKPIVSTTSSTTSTTKTTTTSAVPVTTTSTTLATTTTRPDFTHTTVSTTTSQYVPHTTTTTAVVSPVTTHTSHTFGPFPNTTTTVILTEPTTTWEDWTTTSPNPVDPVTTSSISWEDWTTTTTNAVDPISTSSFTWEDWTTTSARPVDPITTSPTTWADWEEGTGPVPVTITKTWIEPCPTGFATKTTTITTTHCGCTETPKPTACMTTKTFTPSAGWPFTGPIVATVPCDVPVVKPTVNPVSTVTEGAHGGHPVSPVSPAEATSGAWVSPSVTIATTMTVAPTPATPVAPYTAPAQGTKPPVAAFTGAAARVELHALALGAAGVVALMAL